MTALSILLLACSDHAAELHASLNRIRSMVVQAALLSAQAACMPDLGARKALVHGAAVLARRAMGGPVMARIHKMMGMQPGENGTSMTDEQKMNTEMKRHVALHNAGEDVFDFLDAVNTPPGISCRQATPVAMAAAAALLRAAGGPEASDAAAGLNARALPPAKPIRLPRPARALASALRKL